MSKQRWFACRECRWLAHTTVPCNACGRATMLPASVVVWPTESGPSPEQIEAGGRALYDELEGDERFTAEVARAVLLAVAASPDERTTDD